MKIFYHVDVNSAFLSWTAVRMLNEDPDCVDIRTIPSAVCGDPNSRHGIILAKSIPAKKYGVRTAEPIAQAMRKCPDLKLFRSDYGMYSEASKSFISVLEKYAPVVDQFSIDEAFCDMTGTTSLYGDPVAFARRLADEIRDTLGFTVNIGVSENRLLAKMASDFTKPDRVHTLFKDEIEEKMWPLPVGDLLFVGKSAVTALNAIGIKTIGDLAVADENFLATCFGKSGVMMSRYARGEDDIGELTHEGKRKGYSHEMTLPRDITDAREAELVLVSLTESVAASLRRDNVEAKTVTVGITDCDFKKSSRQTRLIVPTSGTEKLIDAVRRLFTELWEHQPIRLLKVAVTTLSDADEAKQMDLIGMMDGGRSKALDTALDSIRDRYGSGAVIRASQVEKT